MQCVDNANRLVIEAILEKLTSVGSVTKVGNIIDDINGQFVTNLTFDDILSFYKYGADSSIEKLQIQGDDCYMEKGDDTCSKSAGGGRTYFYNPDKKELAKVTNDLRTHLGLPAYTKTDSDSKKQVQRKQKNLSLKIQVNANQVTMNQKIAMKTKKLRLTTMNNKEAVLYGGRVLLLFISSQLKIRTF